jgi:mannonate dehydratase
MQMTLRWFGPGIDTVSLWQIRQIPGVAGVVSTLYDMAPGVIWPKERITALREEVEAAGLKLLGIESVNIHDDIKTGAPGRDMYIDNYIKTLEELGRQNVHVICYNFMPVFDWTRSDLQKPREDGATVLAYDQAKIDAIDPNRIFEQMQSGSNGFMLPGWEPERLSRIQDLFRAYEGVNEEKLFEHLVYFLKAIGPVCEKYDIRMAIHPDDPPWPVFGLPRIVTGQESIQRLLKAVDKPYNGLTLCTGSLGANPKTDIPGVIRATGKRIYFAHTRNLRHTAPGVFEEAAHLSRDGSMDMYAILKALYEVGFDGLMRPDHGRAIWGEKSMPGYGLYDRALGAEYLLGLWEAIEKSGK